MKFLWVLVCLSWPLSRRRSCGVVVYVGVGSGILGPGVQLGPGKVVTPYHPGRVVKSIRRCHWGAQEAQATQVDLWGCTLVGCVTACSRIGRWRCRALSRPSILALSSWIGVTWLGQGMRKHLGSRPPSPVPSSMACSSGQCVPSSGTGAGGHGVQAPQYACPELPLPWSHCTTSWEERPQWRR